MAFCQRALRSFEVCGAFGRGSQGLVEYPVVLMGQIRQDFLGLPPECCKPPNEKRHQKYLYRAQPQRRNRISNALVTVANFAPADDGADHSGGERKAGVGTFCREPNFVLGKRPAHRAIGCRDADNGLAPPVQCDLPQKLGTQAEADLAAWRHWPESSPIGSGADLPMNPRRRHALPSRSVVRNGL